MENTCTSSSCESVALHWEEAVSCLLEHGADVNMKDRFGNVPLHLIMGTTAGLRCGSWCSLDGWPVNVDDSHDFYNSSRTTCSKKRDSYRSS